MTRHLSLARPSSSTAGSTGSAEERKRDACGQMIKRTSTLLANTSSELIKDVQTSLNCSMKMPNFIFRNSDLDLDETRFLKWLKDLRGSWNTSNTTTTA